MNLTEHRTDLADPEERGVATGRVLAGEISRALAAYAGFWREYGVEDREARDIAAGADEALASWDPSMRAELAGIARGAGLDRMDVVMLNARTEVLARAREFGECSTVAMVDAGAPRTIQSWDWYPDLAPVGILSEHPSDTDGVKTFTEPGMLAKIGLNGAGLGLHFNILHHEDDGAGAGVPVHLVAARVLREARSVAAAVDLARSAPLAASTVLTVVGWDAATPDRPAEGVCLELSPSGIGVIEPDADGFLWHTNHFRDPVLAEGDTSLVDGTTWDRGKHLDAQRADLRAAPDAVSRAAAMCGPAAGDAPVNVRCTPADPLLDRFGTLLTVSLDLEHGVLDVAPGVPADFAEGHHRF